MAAYHGVPFVPFCPWNFASGAWFVGAAETAFEWFQMAGKIITVCMHGVWGFCLCKWVIFK